MSAERQVIRQSRGKLSYGLIGSLAFVALSVFTIDRNGGRYDHETYDVVGWLGGLFLSLTAGMAAAQLVRPATLELTPEGLTWTGPFWRRRWRWADVSEFEVVPISRTRMIAFAGLRADTERVQAVMQGVPTNHVPGYWRLDLPELCDTLNAARERWREPPAQPMSLP